MLRDESAPRDMTSHFQALSAMEVGFFPLASTGFPNGSIHIGKECSAFVTEDGFRCLADGEVIAYRLDSTHQLLRYDTERTLRYSLGFVLVRHRVPIPPLVTPTEGQPVAGTAPAGPASVSEKRVDTGARTDGDADDGIHVYSLYSYNRPLSQYPTDTDGLLAVSLPFWVGTHKYRVGTRAKDVQLRPERPKNAPSLIPGLARSIDLPAWTTELPLELGVGLRVRAGNNGKAAVIGILPQGCIITVRGTAVHGWAQVAAIERGGPLPYVCDGDVSTEAIANGWVYLDELESVIVPNPMDAVVVLNEPYPVHAGDLLGFMGENPSKELAVPDGDIQRDRPVVAIEVFAGKDFPVQLAESRRRAAALPDGEKTVLVIECGAKLCSSVRPPDLVLPPGYRVLTMDVDTTKGRFMKGSLYRARREKKRTALKKNEKIGSYLGALGTDRIEVAEYKKLSLPARAQYEDREVFAPIDDAIPRWACREQDSSKGMAIWNNPPLSFNDADVVTTFQATFPPVSLSSLDESRYFAEADGTKWWQVQVGGQGLTAIYAWVCNKNHPGTRWESPSAWPGFDVADGSSFLPLRALQRITSIKGTVYPEHEESFLPAVNALGASELVVKLEKAIDHAGTLDGKVTADDIAVARQTPWLARGLSRIIDRMESQWTYDLERWDDLTEYMHSDWQTEMRRQRLRGWWKIVASEVEGFPIDPSVYHIHPFGWVDNFIGARRYRSLGPRIEAIFAELGLIISDGEGSYEAYNSGTKGVKPDPGKDMKVGHSFPSPPNGTVTSRTVNQILATDALSGTDITRMFATGKYQTTIETLRKAKAALELTGDELYNEELQEYVFRDYLLTTGSDGHLYRFIAEGKGTAERAQLSVAKVWASIAVPKGMKSDDDSVSDGAQTYFKLKKKGANKASVRVTERLHSLLSDIQAGKR
jgi:hypothetical protein